MSLDLDDFFSSLTPFLDDSRWWLGFSGGVDSRVLLELLSQASQRLVSVPSLTAVYINHGLSPSADHWAEQCRKACEGLGVAFLERSVDLGERSLGNLEARAREARYQVFTDLVGPNQTLFLGHHRDDQLETLLMRWMRGSGPKGLAGMPKQRNLGEGRLYRPLLETPRIAIENYAQQRGLDWVEDESNRDLSFDRNLIRQTILPLLRERWPDLEHCWERNAELQRESTRLNEELAEIDLQAVSSDGENLRLNQLLGLSAIRQRNLLRYWLHQGGFNTPSLAQLNQVIDQLTAAEDASLCVEWEGVQIRRHNGQLYAVEPALEFDSEQEFLWDFQSPLQLPCGGELLARPVVGAGIKQFSHCKVRFRRQGDRCRPVGRGGSRSLKKLLQELQLPQWERAAVPLLVVDEEIAAVADRVVCEGFGVSDQEPGWELVWVKKQHTEKPPSD